MKRFPIGPFIGILAIFVTVAVGLNGGPNDLFPLGLPPLVTAADTGARATIVDAADDGVTSAIQQVIQRSNDEQVQAIAARDVSVMADTLTSEHYQELVQINQDLLDNG